MANTILTRNSQTLVSGPTELQTAGMKVGELAVNTASGLLFMGADPGPSSPGTASGAAVSGVADYFAQPMYTVAANDTIHGSSLDDARVISTTASKPVYTLENMADDATSGELKFNNSKAGADGDDADQLGLISFHGASSDGDAIHYASIKGIAADTDNSNSGDETGKISFATSVTNSTSASGLADILTITGGASAAASTVAIAGNLTVAGTTTTENTVVIESTVTSLQFEGSTDNAHETTLGVVEPTADTDILLPTLTAGTYHVAVLTGATTDAAADVTPAEFALLDGATAATGTTLASADRIIVNDAGTMKQCALSDLETFMEANLDTMGSAFTSASSLVTVGALDSGSITSGFGGIDNGTSGIRTDIFTAETSFLPSADDGATLGSANLNISDIYIADAGVIYFGDDQDVSLTHVHDAGLLMSSTDYISFNDATQKIWGSSGTVLNLAATDEIDLTATEIEINGNADINGDADVSGTLTVGTFAPSALTSTGLITSTSDTDAEYVAALLVNQSDANDTTGSVSIRFDLEDTAGTAVDAGKIKITKEAAFTSTAGTQDSTMAFFTSLNGTLTSNLTLTSAGVLTSTGAIVSGGTVTGSTGACYEAGGTDVAVTDGGTGLSTIAKGCVLVSTGSNTLAALDGGGSTDKILTYSQASDTWSVSATLSGGTF